MTRVEEIERAIQELTPEEFAQIANHVHTIEQQRWDDQLNEDAASGKLDFLIDEAREDRRAGLLKEWPPSS